MNTLFRFTYGGTKGKVSTGSIGKLFKILDAESYPLNIAVTIERLASEGKTAILHQVDTDEDEPELKDSRIVSFKEKVLEITFNMIMKSENKYVHVSNIRIGNGRPTMEANFDILDARDPDYHCFLDTEKVEWPLELSPSACYVFCLFRNLTGLTVTLIRPEI